jgi:hypothetical protein
VDSHCAKNVDVLASGDDVLMSEETPDDDDLGRRFPLHSRESQQITVAQDEDCWVLTSTLPHLRALHDGLRTPLGFANAA